VVSDTFKFIGGKIDFAFSSRSPLSMLGLRRVLSISKVLKGAWREDLKTWVLISIE
jgi:hypothetical protein